MLRYGGSRPSERFASGDSRQQQATVGDSARQWVAAGSRGRFYSQTWRPVTALWEQAAVGGEEGGEGLGDAIEVVDPDGGVGAPGGDG